MKIEQQVCTLEQAKRLKKLSIKQDASYFSFQGNTDYGPDLNSDDGKDYAAFTVAELGVMLPDEFIKYFDFKGYSIPKSQEYELSFNTWFFNNGDGRRVFGCRYDYRGNINIGTPNFTGTEAEARASMCLYLLENGIETAENMNKRLNE